MKNIVTQLVILVILSLSSASVFAETLVIVHASNNAQLSKKAVAKIFLGKSKKFPNGLKVKAFSLDNDHPLMQSFNKKVLGKSSAKVNAYWSKLVFTGGGRPPKFLQSARDIVERVAENENAIGVIDSKDLSDQVNVAFKF